WFLFFFSSRRRHTRFSRDWSSDVCSSDLWEVEIERTGKYDVFLEWSVSDETAGNPFVFETQDKPLKGKVGKTGSWETFKSEKIRSEERRVGKECRSRWRTDEEKKKEKNSE